MDNLKNLKLVQTEKRRVDRTKAPLSITLFRLSADKKSELSNVNNPLKLFQNRMRETDIVGYINHELIGLILPNTDEEGAQKRIKKAISDDTHLSFSPVTGTYPDQIFAHFVTKNHESPDFYPLFLEDAAKSKRFNLKSARNFWRAPSLTASHDGRGYHGDPISQQGRLDAGSLQIDLLPKSYFLKQLQREKRRADRTKTPLSIVLFRFNPTKESKFGNVKELLQYLQNCIRETDIVGYLREDQIGLLLPDTNQEGAQECLKKIIKRYNTPPFSTITGIYPDQIFDKLLTESKEPASFYPPFLEDSIQPNRFVHRLKRLLDIVGSLGGILLLSPLMLIAVIAIKINSPGPVIFKQIRLGQRGVPFVLYKFRSMYSNTDDRIHREYITHLIRGNPEEINQGDEETPLYKIRSDPRVTRVGRIIRKTSIDELPQLFNVLKGEMSLVGPRPPLLYEVEKYQSWHLRRILDAKPGITGLWQVGGRSQTTFDDMVRLDLQYIRNWSLWLDFQILLKTIKVVFKSAGAV